MENIRELQHPLLENPPGNAVLRSGVLSWASPRHHSGLMPSNLSWFPPGHSFLPHEPLDPCGLQKTSPAPHPSEAQLYPELWKSRGSLGWKKKDYVETAFTDYKEAPELPQKTVPEAEIHTVCYEVGNMELPEYESDSSSDSDSDSQDAFSVLRPQDYLGLAVFSMLCCFWPLGIGAFYLSQKTNKASAMGDYPRAWTTSRQTFALAVLSIVLGICTYIGAVIALIAYLSSKAPT